MTRKTSIDDLVARLSQWGDKSWVGNIGIGSTISESNRLSDDCKSAAEALTTLQSRVMEQEELIRQYQADKYHEIHARHRVEREGAAHDDCGEAPSP